MSLNGSVIVLLVLCPLACNYGVVLYCFSDLMICHFQTMSSLHSGLTVEGTVGNFGDY